MNIFELLFGQIFEAIYFSIFIILAKNIKEKRFIFISLMICEYVIIFNLFPYSIWSHILFFILYYVLMKILYKDKCQIIDMFILAIASLILMLSCIILYFIVNYTIYSFTAYFILNRLFLIGILLIFKNKLNKIQEIYKVYWNRNDKIKKKIKSATFRSLNLVIFNFMFYIINTCMIYMLIQKGGV